MIDVSPVGRRGESAVYGWQAVAVYRGFRRYCRALDERQMFVRTRLYVDLHLFACYQKHSDCIEQVAAYRSLFR